MKKLFAGCFMALLLVGTMIGCGKWDPQPTLTAIAVTPANPSIPKGLTQQFTATGVYSDGTSKDVTASVTWTSATPAVATIVSTTGLATGLTAGTSVMTATSGTLTGTTTLTVTAATLSSITVAPLTQSIVKGLTQQFVATGHYSDGTSQVITATAVWTSGTPAVATLSATVKGLATGVAAGTSVITATSGTFSGTATLTVTAATLTSLTIAPLLPSIPATFTMQFVATGTYSDLTTQNLTATVSWSSATSTVATMNANGTAASGLATGIIPGTSVITATLGSVSGNTTLTVTNATLVSIAVTPANPTIYVGNNKQFVATGTFSDASTLILTSSAIWSSSNTLIATMNPSSQLNSGLATGLAIGTSTITATKGLVAGNTLLTVIAALPPPPGAGHLGSAATYGIMATSAVTNTGAGTKINGDVSLDPGTSMGLLPIQVTGTIHINDSVSAQARLDLLAAYNYYTNLPPGTTVLGGTDLGGLYPISIPPGTYTSDSTMLVSTNITLDGGGNSNAVWVFQIGSSLTTTANVSLIGGAQAKNVFWVCVQDATVGVSSTFNGTIITGRDCTLKTGATVNGRILAGAITAGTIALDTNTVNVPAP